MAEDGLTALAAGVLAGGAGIPQRTILDALPAAVYVTDADGTIQYYNRAAAVLAGREPQIGKDKWCVSWRLYRRDGSPLAHDQCPMALTLKGRHPLHGMEAVAERPDGTRVPFVAFPTPLFSTTGELIGAVNMLVDVSDRRSATLAGQQLASIVESSDDAIVSKDLNGTVVSWNAGAQRLFGYTADEMVGQSITKLMPPDRINEEPGILARIRRGERVDHYETVRQRKDGTRIDISLTISPVRDHDGTIVGASKIARDISARRRSEAALARYMDEQTALFRLSDALHRAETMDDIYVAALDAIQSALRCERAAILLIGENRVMRFVSWRGLSDAYRRAVEGHTPWSLEDPDPQPVCVADVASAGLSDALNAAVVAEGIAACAFIPLMAGGRLIGKFMAYYSRPHQFPAEEVELASAVARQLAFAITKKRAEDDLRENEERLRLATQAGKVGVWEWDIASGRVNWTDSLYAMHGLEPTSAAQTAEGVSALTHPDDRDRVAAAIRNSLETGEPVEIEFRVVRPDGRIVWVFTNAAVVRENGRSVRLLGATIDISERKAADAQRDLLVAELSHRVKNTLATVISIAHQSFSKGPSVDEARGSFDGRIRALAQTHGRLAEGNWAGVSFETMLNDELAPYRHEDGGNVHLDGPLIMLSPKHAVVLGMAFHELATNAAKYGAMSNKGGSVNVAWQINGGSQLRIRWSEIGGPPAMKPKRSGFGRLLLERALAADLQGNVALDFDEAGLTCEITVPLGGKAPSSH